MVSYETDTASEPYTNQSWLWIPYNVTTFSTPLPIIKIKVKLNFNLFMLNQIKVIIRYQILDVPEQLILSALKGTCLVPWKLRQLVDGELDFLILNW